MAELLGTTTRTLYRLINKGQVAAYRLGRVTRLRSENVDRLGKSLRPNL